LTKARIRRTGTRISAPPFVASKRFLRQHMARTGTSTEDYFIASQPGYNHSTDLANRVVLEAFREGLAGAFEPYAYMPER